MELNTAKCHNFDNAMELGRCPLVSVCNDNCLFVWQKYYDGDTDVNKLREDIEDITSEANKYENERNELNEEVNDLQWEVGERERKYTTCIEELAMLFNKKSIDSLRKKYETSSLIKGEWYDDLIDEWELRNANSDE